MALTKVSRGLLSGQSTKNLIINGDMQVAQRGTTFSGLSNGSDEYTLDRWRWDERGSGSAVHEVSQSSTAPSGFAYSARIKCTSGGSFSGVYYFQQKIEGYNTYCTGWNSTDKKHVTLSFWLRSSKTGKFGGAITTSDESYGTAFDVEVASANTWKLYTVAIQPPPTDPTLNTSGVGLILQFTVGTDVTSYRGPANSWHDNSSPLHATDNTTISLDTTNDELYITGVQLELGSVATPFEHRSYGEELALCQRYYQRFHTEGNLAQVQLIGIAAGVGHFVWCPPVHMRANPTVGITDTTPYWESMPWHVVGTSLTVSSVSNGHLSRSGGEIAIYGAYNPALVRGTNYTMEAAVLYWDAEL